MRIERERLAEIELADQVLAHAQAGRGDTAGCLLPRPPSRVCNWPVCPDQNVGLAIGDVAGKGMSAALLMSSLRSLQRSGFDGWIVEAQALRRRK